MKRYIYALGFVLLVYAIWGRGQETTLKIAGGMDCDFERALEFYDIPFEHRGPVMVIETSRKEKLVELLVRLRNDQQTLFDVVSNNISNADNCHTVYGTPYRRQFARTGSHGFIVEIVEDDGAFNWVYDPLHPDAMTEGAKQGYRAHPNVNLEMETTHLSLHSQRLRMLEDALQKLDPDLVLGLPESRYWELKQKMRRNLGLDSFEILNRSLSDTSGHGLFQVEEL